MNTEREACLAEMRRIAARLRDLARPDEAGLVEASAVMLEATRTETAIEMIVQGLHLSEVSLDD